MMRNPVLIAIVTGALAACAVTPPPLSPLGARPPRVVAVEPAEGAIVGPTAAVVLEFSEAIEPSTVDEGTLAVVRMEASEDISAVASSLSDGERFGVAGVYAFAGEGRAVTFSPGQPLDPGGAYAIVATSGIASVGLIPFSQRPNRPSEAFVSTFHVEAGAMSGSEADPASAGSEGSEPGDGEGTPAPRPAVLVINELFYDVPGDDTDGVLFVELAGDPGGDIGGYRIAFVNGADGGVTEEIALPKAAPIPADGLFLIADSKTGQSGVSTIADADFIDNFDPHNGPDCVWLFDAAGNIVDALGYGGPLPVAPRSGKPCVEGSSVPKIPVGQSLGRTGGADTDDNAADFHAQAPTPGVL